MATKKKEINWDEDNIDFMPEDRLNLFLEKFKVLRHFVWVNNSDGSYGAKAW